ncbi:sigma-70 family RNA polymerase sigma factor [Polyangium sp. y55x31]|uniref:sigma-70 family RNA polymerase sigma factor n=1 Tax=Polyangium sp. y55x31 TaxID=3042688 RepID=UPI002482E1F5|nr:sigma-70 family RNA polymerase sigma factor [Polyangium sp. y55x31]MDI1476446.1 sigma-70 family RNA polymerase sigma factor [Polyangium sp. y55x31]
MTRVLDDCSNELGISREATLRYLDAMAAVVRSVGVDSAHVMDIVHHAFLLACRKPKAERPDPKDEAAFGAWLNTVAKYAALTNRKEASRSREVATPTEELVHAIDAGGAHVENYEAKVDASRVFGRLSLDDGSLLHEHFYEGTTIKELAAERGVAWATMRERVDGVIHRARIAVDESAARSIRRRRRRIGAIPLALFGLVAREARAQVGAFWTTLRRSLHRTPARFIGSLGTAAAIFTGTPHLGSCAGDESVFAARAHSVEGRISDDLARHADLVRSRPKPPTIAEDGNVTSPRPPPGRRYEDRSPAPWIIANALRDAEATK